MTFVIRRPTRLARRPNEKQTELTAYLVRLRNQRDPQYRRLTAKRLADADRRHWLTPDAFEKRLNRN